ncbi:hypothetical protein D9615_001053 [Tricholomella constricta]|uniref:Conserved oligomeric Golgi complex subunit 8 n=1 Tax=Tricholomella constricta TaxID=117010 RepID=A0A8H5HK69_9AGAR|nr:hypothetical protein D9615_001053 [Tricholomella constricta]
MDTYETHLTSLALADLVAEPGALQTQAHHLTSSLTSLTHTSYPTFLVLHQSTSALTNSLQDLSSSLSSLITTSLPALQDATAAWHTRTTDILHKRSKARLVLDQHDKIKDLLDIPIFIDSCVRNGYFQEALALATHVRAMATRPGAPLILVSIHVEVEAAIAQMLVVLLRTLNEPGRKLPALWKAVNFLRKMDAFGPGQDQSDHPVLACLAPHDGDRASAEELLALAFLSGRLACLTAALEPISRDIHRLTNPTATSASTDHELPVHANGHSLSDHDKEDIARYLKKYIDVWREGAYDIITQYSTIFLGQHHQNPQTTSLPKSPTSHRRPSLQLQFAPLAPTPTLAPSLLPLLSPHLVSHLLPLLKTTLPLLPLPLLPSLLTQLTYCATAFTRVGLDFRGLVAGIFSSAVVDAVHRGLLDAGTVFSYAPPPAPSQAASKKAPLPSKGKQPSEWLVVSPLPLPTPAAPAAPTQQGPAHIPPQALTAYPPLARYTNALLGVLNALRLLAPVGIMLEVVGALEGALRRAGEELEGYLRGFVVVEEVEGGKGDRDGDGDGSEGEEREREEEDRVARAVGDAYFGVLVPFVRRALVEGVYGVEISKIEMGEGGADGGQRLCRAVREWEEMCGR